MAINQSGPEQQLQVFHSEVSSLRREPLAKSGWETQVSYSFGKGVGLSIKQEGPDETQLRSLLLALRKFVSGREPVDLNRIYNLLLRHLTSDELKTYLIDARKKWRQAQNLDAVALIVDEKELTPERIADLLINGYYFHVDLEKRKQLNNVMGDIALSRFIFLGYMAELLNNVCYVDQVLVWARLGGYLEFEK